MANHRFVDFKGKRVLVSGASSGIGRAICIALSRCGAGLILVGRDRQRLLETAGQLETTDYHIFEQDLSNNREIEPKLKAIIKETGRIYGLCHSAGVVDTRPLNVIRQQNLFHLLDVHLLAGIEMARVVCRRDVMEGKGGALLFVSSIYGRVGIAGQIGYSASKGAVVAAARSMAVELARRNIRVNTLSPGFVKTPMTDEALKLLSEEQRKKIWDSHPLGILTPEDAARAAVFLLAPENKRITGIDLVVDGGYTAQ